MWVPLVGWENWKFSIINKPWFDMTKEIICNHPCASLQEVRVEKYSFTSPCMLFIKNEDSNLIN